MKTLAKPVSLLSLAVTAAAPALFALGVLGEGAMKALLLAATVTWFAAAPGWMKTED